MGNHQDGDVLALCWENLLDLSRNIYPTGDHLHYLSFFLVIRVGGQGGKPYPNLFT